jgi:PST family polysaccharide transporter
MNWGEQGLSAFFSFFLASILGPSDFGIVAIGMVYILFLQMFLDQGLVAALIQRKDLQREHLDSVFWMVLGISGLLVGLSLGLSPWWSAANHVPKLAAVISVLSLVLPIEALTVVQKALFQRNMDFRSLSIRSLLSVGAGGVVGIVMGLRGFGPWALVGQRLTQDGCALVLLWTLSHWRPRFRFAGKYIRDLLGFSLANFTAKLGIFANSQAEAFFMGLFFGPFAVGLYRLPQRLVTMVVQVSTSSLQVAAFPQFSRVQDDDAELGRSALLCLRMSSIVTLPLMAGLAVSSRFVMGVIGPNWVMAVPVLTVLAAVGAVSSLVQFTGPLLQAKSKPHYLAGLVWISSALVISTLVVVALVLRHSTVPVQITGISYARLIIILVFEAPVNLYLLTREARISPRDILRVLLPSLIAAAGVVCVSTLFSMQTLARNLGPLYSLGISIFLSAITAGSLLLLFDRGLRRWVLAFDFGRFRLTSSRDALAADQSLSAPSLKPELRSASVGDEDPLPLQSTKGISSK